MEMWFYHTGVDKRGIHRKRMDPYDEEEQTEINLTPMLDVVMIMLIFFIVAGTFVTEVVVEVKRTDTTNQASSKPSENINILITAADEIWVAGRRIDARALRANVSRMKAEKPKAKVIIRANNRSRINTVAAVVDNCREAGIYDIALSTAD